MTFIRSIKFLHLFEKKKNFNNNNNKKNNLVLNISDSLISGHVGTKDLSINCLFVACNLHDSIISGSRITTLGNGGDSHWWLSTLKLCPVGYLTIQLIVRDQDSIFSSI
jgi:hypothetical protein